VLLGGDQWLDRLDGQSQSAIQLRLLFAQRYFAAGHPSHVKQIVEQTQHLRELSLNNGVRPGNSFCIPFRPVDNFQRAANRHQRIAQFVRKYGQELVHVLTHATRRH